MLNFFFLGREDLYRNTYELQSWINTELCFRWYDDSITKQWNIGSSKGITFRHFIEEMLFMLSIGQ